MASPPAALADELRALYRGPLGDFVAGRQALAKQLRRAADARAPEVATLRKPSLSAWAVNQLFAREAVAMAALVGAGRQARAAQAKGAAAPLREALATIRAEIVRLVGVGAAALASGDRVPGEGIVERLQHDLEALALDPAAAEIADRGWLDEDLEPPGFEILAALQVAAAGPPTSRQGGRPAPASRAAPAAPAAPQATVHSLDDARARREAEAELRRQRERRERIDRLAADAGRADAEAARQRRAAEEAVRAAERAAAEAAEAARRAAAAQGAVAAAEDRAQRAEAAAAKAREALQAVLGSGD